MASVFGSTDDTGSSSTSKLDEVLISQQQQQVVKTGIPGFDEHLGQGLPSGNVYLLAGPVDSNSEQFVQQVLYTAIVSKQPVTYYNVDNSSTDIIQNMKIYGMNIQQYVDEGSWKFARVIPNSLKKIVEALPEEPMEERIYLDETFTGLMNHYFDNVKEKRHTAISLTSLVRNYPLEEIQNLMMYMKGIARRHGGIHFLTLTDDTLDKSTSSTIKDLVDAVFEIDTTYRGNEIETGVSILKIRNMIPKTRKVRLTQRESGLSTETIRRVQ